MESEIDFEGTDGDDVMSGQKTTQMRLIDEGQT